MRCSIYLKDLQEVPWSPMMASIIYVIRYNIYIFKAISPAGGPLVPVMAFITRDSGGADDTAVPSFMTAVDDDPFASGPALA